MDYEQAIEFLYGSLPMYQRIGAKAFKKDLTNTLELCNRLGNPHKKFRSVHIAGTNGKGTSAHTIAAILQAAGYKTGLYTSPHLKSFTERIRINGQPISQKEVASFVTRHQPHLQEVSPSFFETTVVMAFDYFATNKVDIAVIEVGMGGRFDSTNVITPEVSLITEIGFDHQQFLGDTLEKIAFEKAGIIKEEKPVVIGADQPEILHIFEDKAHRINAPIYRSNGYQVADKNGGLIDVHQDGELLFEGLQIGIKGKYYLKNIPGILETINQLSRSGFPCEPSDIKMGFSKIHSLTGLKGRWQILSDSPLTICDVGHNLDGIREVVKQLKAIPHKQLYMILGTVDDKDLSPILSQLPKKAFYFFCQASIPRAMPAEKLQALAAEQQLQGMVVKEVNQAILEANSKTDPTDLIFIGGSTFIVAEINYL